MKTFRADLHCHSYYSDGEDSPFELLAKAKAAGLQGLSITDHDTMEAYSPDVFEEAKRLKIQLLTGIELSSELQDASIHVLGYGFDWKNTHFQQFLAESRKRRRTRNLAILEKLKKHKMPIEEEELIAFVERKSRIIGRPHIAQLMIKKGYVLSVQEAFERYLREGASCYPFGIKFHPREAIDQIHQAGGKAVLAHPHFLRSGVLKKELLSLFFDGIECHYGTLPKELEQEWVKLAEKRGWLATGGSDYHGSFKPHVSLGCSWVGEAVFNKLLEPA